ncbi:unnamed protein product, partial [Symbiodinium necroappetens]
GEIHQIVQNQFFPPIIKNLLLRTPLAGASILGNGSTLEIICDCYSKSESDSRYLSPTDLGSLDARYFPNNGGPEVNGILNIIQTQFTPKIIRNLLCRGQSDGRYPLIANFNSLGSTVNSLSTRVTDLENNGGLAPTTDLTVNSVTAASFLDAPELRSSAGDLQIQNALVTIRKEDGALLASFADGGISFDRDVTVAAASTLNATSADFAQFFVGSTAATGTFNSNSSVTANLEVVSNLRLEAPLLRCDPTAPQLTIEGGTSGVLVDSTLVVNGLIAPDASLPFLSLSGGSGGVQVLSPLLEQIAVGPPAGSVGMVIRNAAPTGD